MSMKTNLDQNGLMFLLALIKPNLGGGGELPDLSNYATKTEMNTAITTALASSGYQTAEQVVALITDALAGISSLHFVPVDELPEIADADHKAIYLVPNGGEDGNLRDEYILIDGAWELLGTTAIDMSGYLREEDLHALTNAEIQAIWDNMMGGE